MIFLLILTLVAITAGIIVAYMASKEEQEDKEKQEEED